MISIAQIRDYAAGEILGRHPELVGRVTFDAHVPMIHRGMHMVELRVVTHDYQGLREHAQGLTPHPHGVHRQWPLGKILDHYCSNEPLEGRDFELGGLEWLIGDGDDHLALSEVSSDTIVLWVRAWEER